MRAPISISACAKSPGRLAGASARAAAPITARDWGERRLERHEARENPGDVAVHGERLALEADCGDRRRGVVADARQTAKRRLLVRKASSEFRDRLGASMQVASARIIAEPGESADDRLLRRRRKRLDIRPCLDEAPVIGRNSLGGRLLEEHFRQPDAIGIGRLAGAGPPRKGSPVEVPPAENALYERFPLCGREDPAYIDVHACDLTPAAPTMKAPRSRAKALSAFVPKIIGETLAARGMGEASLIADWPAIVGEAIAAYARPIELQVASAVPEARSR